MITAGQALAVRIYTRHVWCYAFGTYETITFAWCSEYVDFAAIGDC